MSMLKAVLGEQPVALLQHDVVHEAEIVGRHERRGNAAGGVALDGGDPIGGRLVVAAVVLGVRHLPAARHGAPDEIEFLVGGEAFAGHRHRRSDRTMRRADPEPPHIAARRLGERRCRAEFGRARRARRRAAGMRARGRRARRQAPPAVRVRRQAVMTNAFRCLRIRAS